MDYNITYRKKDKGWQYIISLKEDGKWKQKSKQGFESKALAKKASDKKLDEMKGDLELSKGVNSEYKGITFKEFTAIYVKHKELYSEYATTRTTSFSIKKFSALDDMALESITSLDIQICIDNIVKEGLKKSTVDTYVSHVKTIFNFAIDPHEIILKNPFIGTRVLVEREEPKQKALNKSELDDLLNKVTDPRNHIMSLLAATCGLRLGEIMGLTWDCVNFKDRTIKIDKQWKILEEGKWGLGVVKQRNSNRTIPVPPKTLTQLKNYKLNQPTDLDNRIILYTNKSSLSSNLERNYRREGYNVTVHDLRHTYATMLIANGVDFKTAAKLLGHDIEMTMKVYSHVNDDMMDKATLTVNSIFN